MKLSAKPEPPSEHPVNRKRRQRITSAFIAICVGVVVGASGVLSAGNASSDHSVQSNQSAPTSDTTTGSEGSPPAVSGIQQTAQSEAAAESAFTAAVIAKLGPTAGTGVPTSTCSTHIGLEYKCTAEIMAPDGTPLGTASGACDSQGGEQFVCDVLSGP